MQDSITIAEVGSMVKVSGSRMATPFGPPRPGSTPTKMPSTSPTIIRASVFQVSSTAKPCISRPKASITQSQIFRRCEERLRRSNPALACGVLECFASLAMTTEMSLSVSEGRFQRAFRHDDVEGDVEGHEHDRGEKEGGEQRFPPGDLADQSHERGDQQEARDIEAEELRRQAKQQ